MLQPEASRTSAHEAREATRLLSLYFAGLPLGKGLPETDLQPADDLALLSAQALIMAWWHDRSSYQPLECAAAVLAFALRRSRHKYQMRVLLVRLLRLLGAPSMALEQYRKLEVKSIQQDSVSHFILDRASTFSFAAAGDQTVYVELSGTTRWYRAGERDAAEACVRVWSTQTFTKVRVAPCKLADDPD